MSPNNTQGRLLVSLKTPTQYCVVSKTVVGTTSEEPSAYWNAPFLFVHFLPAGCYQHLNSTQAGDLSDPDTTSHPHTADFCTKRCSCSISYRVASPSCSLPWAPLFLARLKGQPQPSHWFISGNNLYKMSLKRKRCELWVCSPACIAEAAPTGPG